MLIGRENIANAKGAIIELVKNCYDADSPFCAIYIDNEFSELPLTLSHEQIEKLKNKKINSLYFDNLYHFDGCRYVLISSCRESFRRAFAKRLQNLACIYIIDTGEGMTRDVIENHWMTIGTDNKLINFASNSSRRVKSGAKGIGRFALDKLGSECLMITVSEISKIEAKNPSGHIWKVNWKDFEGKNKTIGEVKASLEEFCDASLFEVAVSQGLEECLKKVYERIKSGDLENKFNSRGIDFFSHGTILKISNLNDIWSERLVNQVFNDLEVLIPPKDIEDFGVYLFASSKPEAYGEVSSTVCDDFDYKIVAVSDNNQNIAITIYREEYDVDAIPADFFERPAIKENDFSRKEIFLRKLFSKNYTYSKLLPGLSDSSLLEQIGPFEFVFYFLKKGIGSSLDAERFFYKKFLMHGRKEWLSKFGGIKLYRDNFRVRPYGEVGEPAFDWLGLGARKAASPAGVGKSDGGYRVEPENVAGAIKISRLTNLDFEDKSSREGLQETATFSLFKNLVIAIIGKFEEDRSFFAKEMSLYDKEKNAEKRDLDKMEQLVKSILERERSRKKDNNAAPEPQVEMDLEILGETNLTSLGEEIRPENNNEIALAHLIEAKTEIIERLIDEQKILRGLASSGIVSASFGHDLSKISYKLESRIDELVDLLEPKITEGDFLGEEDWNNPFVYLNQMRKQDKNILTWLGFALGFTRKDKRKRKQLYLGQYFEGLQQSWKNSLDERGISLDISCSSEINMRAFEIDFDGIFINLLVNSMEAFSSSKCTNISDQNNNALRLIKIVCLEESDKIVINYHDTGPGLSADIDDPEKIFSPLYTTKRDVTGQETGTGLGMWIIKSIAEEYNSQVKLVLDANGGFGIKFSFPVRYAK